MLEFKIYQNKGEPILNWIKNSLCTVLMLSCFIMSHSVLAREQLTDSPIIITGISDSLKENVEIHLDLKDGGIPLSTIGFPRSNEFILRKTTQAMQALGYYSPKLSLQGDHGGWQLEIDKGPPILWQSANFILKGKGIDNEALNLLVNSHPFIQGNTVDHGLYKSFKTRLQTLSQELGFLAGEFQLSEFQVNVEDSTAKLNWVFDTGERYSISSIDISGSDLSNVFVARYITLKKGQPYSRQDVINTQQALNRSGYFQTVYLTQQQDDSNHQIDIQIDLNDISKYEFKTKLGFGTDSGGKIGASWQDRQVNDRGHQYVFGIDVSEIEQAVSFKYNQPLDGSKNQWINRYSYRLKNEELAETKVSTIESQVLLYHDKHWFSQSTLTLAFETVDSQANIDSYLNYLIPSWQINYYSVDDPFKAQTGWRWQGEVRLSDDSISDPDIRFIQVEQRAKSIWRLSEKWRLLSRLSLGYTSMDEQQFDTRMPTTYRFFAGGDVSVRGYDYQTLSPKDINGIVLGGRHLMTASVELDWQFKDDFRWAIFADSGSSFNDWNTMNQRQSIGTGIRWITPVGSIRVDYAKALDELKGWRFHITIGPDL